ncbi:MAG: hypothetical protein HY763_16745 [Planctomycetes bacterium]|nr:hypothetical protein [Planctomycetota bacterium]
MGAEIWVRIDGLLQVDPGELMLLVVDTRPSYLSECTRVGGGGIAQHTLRWTNTLGETGQWGETVSATIGAKTS